MAVRRPGYHAERWAARTLDRQERDRANKRRRRERIRMEIQEQKRLAALKIINDDVAAMRERVAERRRAAAELQLRRYIAARQSM